jgi:hypothetical protein
MSSTDKSNQINIDFRTLPTNVPSLCIPRVFINITETKIRKVFEELEMGKIERVDIVPKTSERGEKFNRIFIHFSRWNSEGNAGLAREQLLNGKEIKIIYDEPWFWKISAYRESESKNRRPNKNAGDNEQSRKQHKKPCLVLEEEQTPSSTNKNDVKQKYIKQHPQRRQERTINPYNSEAKKETIMNLEIPIELNYKPFTPLQRKKRVAVGANPTAKKIQEEFLTEKKELVIEQDIKENNDENNDEKK